MEGIELPRFTYQPAAWSKPRWVIGIRQNITQRTEPKGKTLNLFSNDPVGPVAIFGLDDRLRSACG